MDAFMFIMLIIGWLMLQLPEKGFAQYLSFDAPQPINIPWLVGGVTLVLLVIALALISRLLAARRRRRLAAEGPSQRKKLSFQRQAAQLGFRVGEIKLLRLIAGKLEPHNSEGLLTTDAGREHLTFEVDARILQREQEIELLRGIQHKLKLMRERGLRERGTLRMETNLSVWIVKKTNAELNTPRGEEDLFADVEQISGRLLNLSEGGAAVAANLKAVVNDVLEIWSADPQIWIPPITAGVLQIERDEEHKTLIFHLHFIDPPLNELRLALQAIHKNSDHSIV